MAPKFPSAEILRDVRLQVPLCVSTRDHKLLAEFGEKRLKPLRLDEVPERLVQAFLAGEDDRFFEHPGVDWQGLTRAVLCLVRTGEKGPGGSTITMPKAPSRFNPITNPKQAVVRRNYVLRCMLELGYIEQDERDEARDVPVAAKAHGFAVGVEAPHVAEIVRAHMEETYGDDVYPA